MASDVLTQQTMGRGLRLPFGSYTKVSQIDQLDIIAHQSFKELLETENVLVEFGLEDAAPDPDKINDQIRAAAQNSADFNPSQSSSGSLMKKTSEKTTASNHTSNVPTNAFYPAMQNPINKKGQLNSGQPSIAQPSLLGSVGFASIEQSGIFDDDQQGDLTIETVSRNPSYAKVTYLFPRTEVKLGKVKIDLSKITPEEIRRAAERVTSTGDVLLRKEIIAALGSGIRVSDTESAKVESTPIDFDHAKRSLLQIVMNQGKVPATEGMKNFAKSYLVKRFMEDAPIDHWTVKSLESADRELKTLIDNFTSDCLRKVSEETEIHPLKMPTENELRLPLGDQIHEQIDKRGEFIPNRFYGDWHKSLFLAESFDSYTGEYLLAKLLDTSPHIIWWQRLHVSYGAYVYYNAKDRYYPDFVALDDTKTHWIIEGKDARGRDDELVQKKRRAAESVVVQLLGDERFEGQPWGYLIAYEDDICSSDSWSDLKAKSRPVTTSS
jgi:type III restriction enzyme